MKATLKFRPLTNQKGDNPEIKVSLLAITIDLYDITEKDYIHICLYTYIQPRILLNLRLRKCPVNRNTHSIL